MADETRQLSPEEEDQLRKTVLAINRKYSRGEVKLTPDRIVQLSQINGLLGYKNTAQALLRAGALQAEADPDVNVGIGKSILQDTKDAVEGIGRFAVGAVGELGKYGNPRSDFTKADDILAGATKPAGPLETQVRETIAREGAIRGGADLALSGGAFGDMGRLAGEFIEDPLVLIKKPATSTLRLVAAGASASALAGSAMGLARGMAPAAETVPAAVSTSDIGIGGTVKMLQASLAERKLAQRLAEAPKPPTGVKFQAPSSTMEDFITRAQQLDGANTVEGFTGDVPRETSFRPEFQLSDARTKMIMPASAEAKPMAVVGKQFPIAEGPVGPPVSPPVNEALDIHFDNFVYDTGEHAKAVAAGDGISNPAAVYPRLEPRQVLGLQAESMQAYLSKRWAVLSKASAKTEYGNLVSYGRKVGLTQDGAMQMASIFRDANELRSTAIANRNALRGYDLLKTVDAAATLKNAADANVGLERANSVPVTRYEAAGKAQPPFSEAALKATKGAFLGKGRQPIYLFDGHPLLHDMVPRAILAEGRMKTEAIALEAKAADQIFNGLTKTELLKFRDIMEGRLKQVDWTGNPARGELVFKRAEMMADSMKKIWADAGGDPNIQNIHDYFTRLYADPMELKRAIYDTFGGEELNRAWRTDIPVPDEVIPGIMRRRTLPEGMALTIDDPRFIYRAYVRQALRKKYFDPFISTYSDDLLAKVAQTSPPMATLAADYVRDVLGYPTTKEMALRLKLMGQASKFLERYPATPGFMRRMVSFYGNASGTRMVNFVNGLQILSKLGWKAAFIPINIQELVTNIPRELGYVKTTQGLADALIPWTKGGRELRQFLQESGTISESPSIDTFLNENWGGKGYRTLKNIAMLPVSLTEGLNIRASAGAALRKAMADGVKGDPESVLLETIRSMHKARAGFFKSSRPQILRRPLGRFMQPFMGYSYYMTETMGRDIAAMAKGDMTAAGHFARLYAGGVAYQAVLENQMGIDMRNQTGLGWLPLVYYSKAQKQWQVRDMGQLIGGSNLATLHNVVSTFAHIWQSDDAIDQLLDPETYDKLMQKNITAYGTWVRGDSPKEKLFGKPPEE